MFKGITALAVALAAIGTTMGWAGPSSPGVILQKKRPAITFVQGSDFQDAIEPRSEGNVIAPVALAGDGCEASRFDAFTAGSIAVVHRGTCLFRDKVQHAEGAGAVGVIIVNDRPGLTWISLADAGTSIPVVSVTTAAGALLSEGIAHINVRHDPAARPATAPR